MYELEYESELESEFETENEGELEGEFESEQFFSRLAQLAGRAIRSPTVRRVGLAAGRMALRGGLGALGAYAGGRLGGQHRAAGSAVGGGLGYGLGTYLGGLLPEQEWEAELNPQRRIQPAALMEHLGHAATEAESEAEAEAFIGALIPLAARLAPRVAPAIIRAAPGLIRGTARVVQQLRRNPSTRRLVRTVPGIVRRTAANLSQRVARGQPVTPQIAVRALAQQTSQVLGNPQQAVQAWRRSRALDRRYHRAVGDLQPSPTGGLRPRYSVG